MTWKAIIERVKQGETMEADTQMLSVLRKALCALNESYPGEGGCFAALAQVLRVHRQMESAHDSD